MRRDEDRLRDILENIDTVLAAIRGKSRSDFDGDLLLRSAVLHYVQIIGEAAQRVSEDVRAKYPSLPWRVISDTRNFIVHAYFSVDLDIIWLTASRDLLPLRSQIESILHAEFPE